MGGFEKLFEGRQNDTFYSIALVLGRKGNFNPYGFFALRQGFRGFVFLPVFYIYKHTTYINNN